MALHLGWNQGPVKLEFSVELARKSACSLLLFKIQIRKLLYKIHYTRFIKYSVHTPIITQRRFVLYLQIKYSYDDGGTERVLLLSHRTV